MLAILMGLYAWVLDAYISYRFFPGKPFMEVLCEHDPIRTLYVRSVVVILFFIFGLVSGNLISRLEKSRERESLKVHLLRGVDRVHALIVTETDAVRLVSKALDEIRKTFYLDYAHCFLLDPDSGEVLHKLGSPEAGPDQGPRACEATLETRSDQLRQVDGLQVEDRSEREKDAREGSRRYMAPLKFKGTTYALFSGAGQLARFPEGENQGFLESICNDLGHALAKLHDAEVLNHNAQKLTALYENAPVGIFSSTVGGKLVFLNEAMANILGGETPEEVMECTDTVGRFYVPEKRRDSFLKELKTEGWLREFEAELLGIDGEKRITRLAARLTGSSLNGDAVIEGFAMDITHTRQAEMEKGILQKQLQQTRHFKSIAVLAGGIAHEFNNILQAMMGSAYLAQLKTETSSNTWRYLQDIQDSGSRAARLCDQMLSYAGKKAMILKVEPVEDCLNEIRTVLKENIPEAVKIEFDLRAPHARVRMDRVSFSEIVNNLVMNGVEAMKDKPGTVHIVSEVQTGEELDPVQYGISKKLDDHEYWVLSVKDEGVGIEKENLQNVFDPFYTTKFQGRGLGLSAVAGILDKLDGAIGVKSVPGNGAEFLVVLPLAESVLVETEDRDRPAPVSAQFRGKGVIWVVDDEPLICTTIERLLEKWGFEPRAAFDGQEALNKMREEPDGFLCAILDVTMPRMGGLETMRRLREFAPEVPVIIMSGFEEQQSLEQFQGLKVSGFIHKPFQMEELQAKLQQVLPESAYTTE